MTDITALSNKELLELAAKFCGKNILYIDGEGVTGIGDNGWCFLWNPLTDAGDRARACDENGICIIHEWGTQRAYAATADTCGDFEWCEDYSDHNENRTIAANHAATRLMAMMQIEKEKGK